MHFDHIHLLSPNSFQIHPLFLSYSTSNFFIFSIKNNLCCSNTLGSVVFHWSGQFTFRMPPIYYIKHLFLYFLRLFYIIFHFPFLSPRPWILGTICVFFPSEHYFRYSLHPLLPHTSFCRTEVSRSTPITVTSGLACLLVPSISVVL